MKNNDIKETALVFVSLVLGAGMIAITPHDRSKLPNYNKDITPSMGDDALGSMDTSFDDNYVQNVETFKPTLSGTVLENMDTTEKLMLINYYSKSEEERQKDEKEAIPLEECLKKAGLSINDLQDRN